MFKDSVYNSPHEEQSFLHSFCSCTNRPIKTSVLLPPLGYEPFGSPQGRSDLRLIEAFLSQVNGAQPVLVLLGRGTWFWSSFPWENL